MSVCIIGAGISGLAAAIKIKLVNHDQDVLLIDGFYSGSNTQIAGQRYRERESGKGIDPYTEILQLLANRNENNITSEMGIFASLAVKSLKFWKIFQPESVGVNLESLVFQDNKNWFGPQFGQENKAGGGRGLTIITWFKILAKQLGIQIINAEVVSLERIGNKINSISAIKKEKNVEFMQEIKIIADFYILAGGNLGGRMFLSTNAQIYNSPQELAFNVGLPLVDSSIYMFHIAGFCSADGSPKAGCFETDNLSKFQVYLKNNSNNQFDLLDTKTTNLFKEHKAHYHFDEIAKRFIKHDGRVILNNPDNGKSLYARVSHHYSHIAVDTIDGVSVKNMSNLYAVGDASGTGFWTGRKVRLPGFALTKCLTDADWILDKADFKTINTPITIIDNNICILNKESRKDIKTFENKLRQLNTKFLFRIEFGNNKLADSKLWVESLLNFAHTEDFSNKSTLFQITLCTAYNIWGSLKTDITDRDTFSKEKLLEINSLFSNYKSNL